MSQYKFFNLLIFLSVTLSHGSTAAAGLREFALIGDGLATSSWCERLADKFNIIVAELAANRELCLVPVQDLLWVMFARRKAA